MTSYIDDDTYFPGQTIQRQVAEKSKAQRNHEDSMRGNDLKIWEWPKGPYPLVRWQSRAAAIA